MSQPNLDATTTIAQWIPIINARTVAVLLAVDAVVDAMRYNAGDDYVAILRHRAYESLVRLHEAVPDGIRHGLWPEFQIGFDRVMAGLPV